MLGWWRERRRRRVMGEPLPADWWSVIDRRCPVIAGLTGVQRDRLGGIVRVLLDEKHFEGCGGLRMTDEVRVTIAAQAALLVLGRPGSYYPTLRSVLVYPDAYKVWSREEDEIGIVTEGMDERVGVHLGGFVVEAFDAGEGGGGLGLGVVGGGRVGGGGQQQEDEGGDAGGHAAVLSGVLGG